MIERSLFNGIDLEDAGILKGFVEECSTIIRPGAAETSFTVLEYAIQGTDETLNLFIRELGVVPYLDACLSEVNPGNRLTPGRLWLSSRTPLSRFCGKGIARQHIGNQGRCTKTQSGIREPLQEFPSGKVGIYRVA